MTRDELDKCILDAHSKADSYQLAQLYRRASALEEHQGNLNAAGFLLTHAYVFALESGHPDAEDMKDKLARDGRELNE